MTLPALLCTCLASLTLLLGPAAPSAQAPSPATPPPAAAVPTSTPAATPENVPAGEPAVDTPSDGRTRGTTAEIEGESLLDTLQSLKWPETAREWEAVLIVVSVRVVLPLLGVLLIFLLGLFAAKQIRKAAERALTRAKIEITLARFLSKVASWTFIALIILTILSTVGVNITSLAALLGATGLAVGLAIQGALTNLSSGVMLLIFRPYRLGDVVRLDGELGTVADIELFTTRIDTLDNRRIILPNSKIYGNKIENLTRNPQRRVDIPVGIDYAADFEATRLALEAAITRVPGILKAPAPAAVATGFAESSVTWEVRVWCAPVDVIQVRSDAVREIMRSLAEKDIRIPFPQRDLHIPGPIRVAISDRA
jgi:small conductance mechanosensitive channel